MGSRNITPPPIYAAANYFSILLLLLCLSRSPRMVLTVPIGSPCTYTFECSGHAFCYSGQCRRTDCEVNNECGLGELCFFGKIATADFRNACFPFHDTKFANVDWCPGGGGSAIKNGAGHLETCDFATPCPGGHICNPTYGVCCTKLRSCPRPQSPLLDASTSRPVVCQQRGGPKLECPQGAVCEMQSGFCCTKREPSGEEESVKVGVDSRATITTSSEKEFLSQVAVPQQPVNSPLSSTPINATTSHPVTLVGERCSPSQECEDGAICKCDATELSTGNISSECRCRCAEELSYSPDPTDDGHTCRRSRRRLKETCRWDRECQTAYSECVPRGKQEAVGKCRCRRGFRRDQKGGCRPLAYRCVGEVEPLKQDAGRFLVSCVVRRGEEERRGELASTRKAEPNPETKDCPTGYYCVPVYNHPRHQQFAVGFCCPAPAIQPPACPVGRAHNSSKWPNYGCEQCPDDHYCHRDGVVTQVEICCPRACINPGDVYTDGQCNPV